MAAPTTYTDVTVVRNTSGQDGKYFDFLGIHGATLNNNQDMVIPGDLLTMWFRNPQKQASLEYALKHGLLTILQGPATIYFDKGASPGRVYQIRANSNAASVIDPDYGSYTGSAPNP